MPCPAPISFPPRKLSWLEDPLFPRSAVLWICWAPAWGRSPFVSKAFWSSVQIMRRDLKETDPEAMWSSGQRSFITLRTCLLPFQPLLFAPTKADLWQIALPPNCLLNLGSWKYNNIKKKNLWFIKMIASGAPVVAQRIWLVFMRMQVRSLALLSGLRIQCYCELCVLQVTDMAQIWCCCGCAVGWQLQLWFDP